MAPSLLQKQLPMLLTYFRLLMSPVVVILLYLPVPWIGWVASAVFIVASITDYIDGHLARKYNVESIMGQLFDPVADKVLVLSALIMLLAFNRIDPILVILLLSRDAFISGLRSVAAAMNHVIAADRLGKWKTGFQMTGIPCLLIDPAPFGLPIHKIGYACLWVSVVLSLLSGLQYSISFFKRVPH